MHTIIIDITHTCKEIVSTILPTFQPDEDDVDYRLVTQDGIWMEPSKKMSEYFKKLRKREVVELRRKSRARRAESVMNLSSSLSGGNIAYICPY